MMNLLKSVVLVLMVLITGHAMAQLSGGTDTSASCIMRTRYIRAQTNLTKDLCLQPNFGFELQVSDKTALNCTWTMILSDSYWPAKPFYQSDSLFRLDSEYSGKEFSLGMKNFLTEDIFVMSEFSFKRVARHRISDPGYGLNYYSDEKSVYGGKLVFGRELVRKNRFVCTAYLGSGISYVITRRNYGYYYDAYEWVPNLCLGLNFSLQNVTTKTIRQTATKESLVSKTVLIENAENYTLMLSRENVKGRPVKKLLLPHRQIFVKLYSGESFRGNDFVVLADSVIEINGQRVNTGDIRFFRINPKGSALRQVLGGVFFASGVIGIPAELVTIYYLIRYYPENFISWDATPLVLPVSAYAFYVWESYRLMSFRKFNMKNGWQISVVPYLPDEKNSPALKDVQTDNSNHVD